MTRTAPVYTSAVIHFETDPHGRGWVLTLNGSEAQSVEAIGSMRSRVPSNLGYQPPAWVVAAARRHARAAGVRVPARGGWAQRGAFTWAADV